MPKCVLSALYLSDASYILHIFVVTSMRGHNRKNELLCTYFKVFLIKIFILLSALCTFYF